MSDPDRLTSGSLGWSAFRRTAAAGGRLPSGRSCPNAVIELLLLGTAVRAATALTADAKNGCDEELDTITLASNVARREYCRALQLPLTLPGLGFPPIVTRPGSEWPTFTPDTRGLHPPE